MSNRAKCKLCGDIIESVHRHDYVSCKCGEISIDGGPDYLHCRATDFNNFLRVDDEGNEIVVQYCEKEDTVEPDQKQVEKKPVDRVELLAILAKMIEDLENLPPHAMQAPITHADYYSLLLFLSAFFRLT